MGVAMNQREKDIEYRLLTILDDRPREVSIHRSTSSNITTMADLLCGREWDKFHDNSYWNKFKHFMQDVSGGMCPDIVLYSKKTGETRIYIEVKATTRLGYGVEDSQIVRYFLHLLVTTKKVPSKGTNDIRRAVLLCAPSPWFKDSKTATSWEHFLRYFSPLAKAFDITLGELHSSEF